MQSTVYYFEKPATFSAPALLLIFFLTTFPIRVGNFDFRHFTADEGLTLSFSRNSPPLAALQDEHLPLVKLEPAQNLKAVRPGHVIMAGSGSAWLRLKRYAVRPRTSLARFTPKRYVRRIAKHPFRKGRVYLHAANSMSHKKFQKLMKVSELTRLTHLVKTNRRARAHMYAQGVLIGHPSESKFISPLIETVSRYIADNEAAEKSGPSYRSHKGTIYKSQTGHRDIRREVEAPLAAPSVRRGLPTGEGALPRIIPEDHISRANMTPVTKSEARVAKNEVSQPDTVYTPTMGGRILGPNGSESQGQISHHVINNRAPATSNADPGRSLLQASSSAAPVVPPQPHKLVNSKSVTIARTEVGFSQALKDARGLQAPQTPAAEVALANLDSQSSDATNASQAATQTTAQTTQDDQPNRYRILGQIELTGGLAVTGVTKLAIHWKAGRQSREALIDYKTGEFAVDVPTLEVGKVVGRLYDETGRVLGEGIYDMDGSAEPHQTLVTGLTLTVEPRESLLKGRVLSAYSVDKIEIPVKDAEVFAPSSIREVVDSKGRFQASGINTESTMTLDSYAPENWGTRVVTGGTNKPYIPLFSQKMLDSFFSLIGQPDNNTELGVIWGEVKRRGKGHGGVKVALATPQDAIGPFYFNTLRIPDSKLTETSENGLFAFVKVHPGLQLVTAEYHGKELPSSVVSVSSTMVSYTELDFKALTIKGHVYSPAEQVNIQAQVGVIGSKRTTTAQTNGFELKVPSSDSVLFVQATSGDDYYMSRATVPRSHAHDVQVLAFKKNWVNTVFKHAGVRQDTSKGLLIGQVRGLTTFHVTMEPEPGTNYTDQDIHYFSADGQIDIAATEGGAGVGGFVMNNLPPGLHTLVISSAEGQMTTTQLFVSEAGVLNVVDTSLRP